MFQNYLGEIELLTRGQFQGDTPVLYKIKFPKTHFPPKLLQITTNNQVVCLGAAGKVNTNAHRKNKPNTKFPQATRQGNKYSISFYFLLPLN